MHLEKLLPKQIVWGLEGSIRREFHGKILNDGMDDKMKRQYFLELWNTKDLKFVICDTLTGTKRISKNYYKIKWTKANHFNERSILDQYFTKLPNPWGMEILRGYLKNSGQRADAVGQRIMYARKCISE